MPAKCYFNHDKNTTTSRQVGRNVGVRRTQLGMTQSQLAERLKQMGFAIAQGTISRWETGYAQQQGFPGISVDHLVALANVLQTEPTELLNPCPIF